jgi:hypothetical protein
MVFFPVTGYKRDLTGAAMDCAVLIRHTPDGIVPCLQWRVTPDRQVVFLLYPVPLIHIVLR